MAVLTTGEPDAGDDRPVQRVMPPRRVALLVNPAARGAERMRAGTLAAFAAAGVTCTERLTTYAGEAAQLATELAPESDAVFTLGGDGTAMEVIDALANSGVPVGILPGGTGNLVARTLGIPRSAARAVPVLLDGVLAQIDLGRLTTGRRFAFVAGVGIDAYMIARTPPAWKRRLGVIAYAAAAIDGVWRRERFHVRATVDGQTIEGEATAVMIANFGAVLGDLITLGPDIRRDDGYLDLCIFTPGSIGASVRIVWRLWRRDFRDDPCVRWVRGRAIRIETDPPRQAQADGELLGETPIDVAVEPLAATLLVPRTPPRGAR